MGIKLHIALGTASSSFAALIVVEDPQLDFTVVGSRGQEPILEWVPHQVLDGSSVSLHQRCACIEIALLSSIEDGHGRLRGPGHRDHLTIRSDTILFVRVASSAHIHRDQGVKFQVLE